MAFIKKSNRGSVYFFKVNRLTPVKIGMTIKEDVKSRLSSLLTSAPYGGEILGSIKTFHPRKVESELHDRFKKKRIRGEWFDIGKEEIELAISEFEKKEEETPILISSKKTSESFGTILKGQVRDKYIIDIYKANPKFNRTDLAMELNVSRQTVIRAIKKISS